MGRINQDTGITRVFPAIRIARASIVTVLPVLAIVGVGRAAPLCNSYTTTPAVAAEDLNESGKNFLRVPGASSSRHVELSRIRGRPPVSFRPVVGRAAPPLRWVPDGVRERLDCKRTKPGGSRIMGVAWTSTTLSRIGRTAAVMGMVALALGSGCRHRRSAYRPVFVDPEPALINASPSSATIIPTNPSPYDYQYDDTPISSAIGEDVPYLPEPAEAFPSNEPELDLAPVDPIEPQSPVDRGHDDPLGGRPAPRARPAPDATGYRRPPDLDDQPGRAFGPGPGPRRRPDRPGPAPQGGARLALRRLAPQRPGRPAATPSSTATTAIAAAWTAAATTSSSATAPTAPTARSR